MKNLILLFAITLTLGSGCIRNQIVETRKCMAIDTLYAENPQAPGTFLSYYDTITVSVTNSFSYIGNHNFYKTKYRITNK